MSFSRIPAENSEINVWFCWVQVPLGWIITYVDPFLSSELKSLNLVVALIGFSPRPLDVSASATFGARLTTFHFLSGVCSPLLSVETNQPALISLFCHNFVIRMSGVSSSQFSSCTESNLLLCSEDISVVQSRGKRVYSPLNQRFSFPSDCIYVRKIEIALDYICSLFKSFFLGEVLCEAWLMAH